MRMKRERARGTMTNRIWTKLFFCFRQVFHFACSFVCFGESRDPVTENRIVIILIQKAVNWWRRATQEDLPGKNELVDITNRQNQDCWDLVQQEKSEEIPFQLTLPAESKFGHHPQGSGLWLLFQLCPGRTAPLDLPWLPPNFARQFFLAISKLQIVQLFCHLLSTAAKRKKKWKRKGKEKIPQCYNLVLSVNQTFPVMLIACVSLMYFILLKSFETLQLSSYRPLCGYH